MGQDMMRREIIFYQNSSGKYPVETFLESLENKERRKVEYVLNLIREIPLIHTKFFKKLESTEDIWEV